MNDATTRFTIGDVSAELRPNHVAVVEMHRPPNNALELGLIRNLADVFERLDSDLSCYAIVLASEGRHFCAGADLGSSTDPVATASGTTNNPLYEAGLRLFAVGIPIVAAIQGAAVGGGLGLALVADFRVTCPEARLTANFTKLGLHHGFGTTVTLPRLVGIQRAHELLLTGRRVGGEEAVRIGLCDRLVAQEEVRNSAIALAEELAGNAPLAMRSVRHTMRGHLAQEVAVATLREHQQQQELSRTHDHKEGVSAYADRRTPVFIGR